MRRALWWDQARGAGQIDDILGRREAGQLGRFAAGTVMIMQDGSSGELHRRNARTYLDRCGCQTGAHGLSHVDLDELAEQVTALDALGFQVNFHGIGDRAVRSGCSVPWFARWLVMVGEAAF